MKLANRLIEALKSIDYELIAHSLHNDEASTDDELVDFINDETKIDKKKLQNLMKKERSNFLGPKYKNNKPNDDKKIIKKYVG